MSYPFVSEFRVGSRLPNYSADTVKNEPMLFNCTAEAAAELGGPITRKFLELLPERPAVVDTRVHMLMPGWFPCIPGWHHDDVPRSGPDGQPNYDTPEYRSRHVMALVGDEICSTEFAVGSFDMPAVEGVIYKAWHPLVERAIRAGDAHRASVPHRRLIHFDDRAFHQGVRATGAGWRWFGRASFDTDRVPTNEVRRQVQVYLEYPMEGW